MRFWMYNSGCMGGKTAEMLQMRNPEQPRSRKVRLDLREFGFKEAKEPLIEVKEVTSLITGEDGRKVVVQSLTWEPEISPEREGLPKKPIVVVGGGSSESYGNAGLIGRIHEAILLAEDGNPSFNYNIIVLPHVFGSARENPFVANPQTKEEKNHNRIINLIHKLPFIGKTGENYYEETFAKDAEILQKALEVSEVGCGKNKIIYGYSAGGKQAIELAARLGEDVDLLMLADSAGLANHPDLSDEISGGTIKALLKKYRNEKKENLVQTVRDAIWEMGQAYVTPKGPASDLIRMAFDFTPFSPQRKLMNRLANDFGLNKKKTAGIGAKMDEIKLEVEEEARLNITAPIIASPIMYARVVNFVYEEIRQEIASVGGEIQKNQDLRELYKQLFDTETSDQLLNEFGMDALKRIFPKSKGVSLVLHEDSTHPVPMWKQKYVENLFQKANEVLKTN